MTKLLSGLTAAVILLTAAAIPVFAEPTPISGKCGENAIWSFDEATGVLTILGNGDMNTNYTPVDQWGYYPYRNEIKEVVVKEGITSISECAFGPFAPYGVESTKYPNLAKITLPETMNSIGNYAFFKAGLESIVLPEGLETIGVSAFSNTLLSGDLVLPKTLNSIGQDAFLNTNITSVNLNEGMALGGCAFANCNNLKEVTIPENLIYGSHNEGNMTRSNKAFVDCKGLEKVTVLGGGTVNVNLNGYIENGLARELFRGCTSLKDIIIKADDISYVEAYDKSSGGNTFGTFEITSNPTFYIYKDSTTEATLRDAGYLTDSNVVYIANKTVLEGAVMSAEDMDKSLYTSKSVDTLNKAIEAGKAAIADEDASQADVDNAIKVIEDAIDGLKYPPADYTAVDEAIAKVPADLSIYTDETAAAVTAAVESVDRTKNITDQVAVDGYAKAIEDAIAALELKTLLAISGTVTAPGVDTEVTVTVTDADGKVVAEVIADGKYTVSDLEYGEYVIIVMAENCAPRSYGITVAADGEATLDAEMHLYGDINGDGQITTADVGLANAHARGTAMLKGYDFDVADVTSDGEVTTADVGAINSHAQSVRALW